MADQQTIMRALREWRETSFRLESLDQYTVEPEEAILGAFLHGEPAPPPDQGLEDWLAQLRRERAAGRRRVRVHAIGGPLTPYLHYEIGWGYTANALAGEEIHILHRESWADTPFGDRPPDFYLLDDQAVVVMAYDEVGHWLGGEVITDPDDVDCYRHLRDQALAEAVPLREYLAAQRRMPAPPPATLQPAALRHTA